MSRLFSSCALAFALICCALRSSERRSLQQGTQHWRSCAGLGEPSGHGRQESLVERIQGQGRGGVGFYLQ